MTPNSIYQFNGNYAVDVSGGFVSSRLGRPLRRSLSAIAAHQPAEPGERERVAVVDGGVRSVEELEPDHLVGRSSSTASACRRG